MAEFRAISEFLDAALPQNAERPAPPEVQRRLEEYWRAELGAAGAHSTPLLFSSGRLVALVEASAWGNEIRHRAPRIAAALRARGIAVSEVTVKTQPEVRARMGLGAEGLGDAKDEQCE